MSVRSFRSVFLVGGVAAAALSCYLVSLRVASERAALENVESRIVLAQRDIRLLQTEIGTRGRLAQLERWNVRVLLLSAPSADQFVPDSFQLARLATPERNPVEAPLVYASAPAPEQRVLPEAQQQGNAAPPPAKLMHEAGLKTAAPVTRVAGETPKELAAKTSETAPAKPKAEANKPKTQAVESSTRPKLDAAKPKTGEAFTSKTDAPLVKIAQADSPRSAATMPKKPTKTTSNPATGVTDKDSGKTQ